MAKQNNSLAHCPSCGSKTAEKAWYPMTCTNCGFVFYFNPAASTVGIIENERGEVVVATRGKEPHKGALDLPGGFIDRGESAEEALHREIDEELGIKIKGLAYFTTTAGQYEYQGIMYFVTDIVFIAKPQSRTLRPADDVSRARWVEPKTIRPDLFGLPQIQETYRKYLGSLD